MRIIGCDLHARQQALAMLDTETGEVVNRTLQHEGKEVREFYSQLPRPVLVGIVAGNQTRSQYKQKTQPIRVAYLPRIRIRGFGRLSRFQRFVKSVSYAFSIWELGSIPPAGTTQIPSFLLDFCLFSLGGHTISV
jgi:hypothetical protein